MSLWGAGPRRALDNRPVGDEPAFAGHAHDSANHPCSLDPARIWPRVWSFTTRTKGVVFEADGVLPEVLDQFAVGGQDAKASWGKVPVAWLVEWFAGLDGGPSKQVLDLVDSQDSNAIRDFFTVMTQLPLKDPVPKLVRERDAMFRFLKLRMVQVGLRMQGWFQLCVKPNGQVEYSKQHLFKLEYDMCKLTNVIHISGDVAAIPAHVIITDDFRLMQAYDDSGAKLARRPRTSCRTSLGLVRGPIGSRWTKTAATSSC